MGKLARIGRGSPSGKATDAAEPAVQAATTVPARYADGQGVAEPPIEAVTTFAAGSNGNNGGPPWKPKAPDGEVSAAGVAPAEAQPPVPPNPPAPSGVVIMPAGLMRELFRDAGSPGAGAAAAATPAKPSRKRTFWLVSLGALLGSLMFALINFFVLPKLLYGEPAEPVAFDDALAEFREDGGSDSSDLYVEGGDTALLPGEVDAGAAAPEASTETGSTGGGGGSSATAGAPQAGAAAAASKSAPVLRPAAGVYTFGASGSESTKLNNLAETNQVGPNVAAIVRHSGGACWSLELKFNSKHSSSDTFCAGPGALNVTGGSSNSVTLGQSVNNAVKCDPAVNRVVPGMAPGASWQGTCTLSTSGVTSSTSTNKETWSYVGAETVAGTPAFRLRGQGQSTGGASGTTDQHVWISQTNGMVLKFQRAVRMVSSTPIGSVVYTEEIGGTIKSLTPQT
jgi:hypothetical protein